MKKAFLLLLILVFPAAHALDLEYYKFSNTSSYNSTETALLKDGLGGAQGPWLFTSSLNYVKVPLSIESNNTRVHEIVRNQASLHLGGAYKYKENLLFGVRTHASRLKSDDSTGFFLGDTVLESIWKFYELSTWAVALQPRLSIPTGSQLYTTNRKVGGYLGLNLEKKFDAFQMALNLGYSHQPGATLNYGSGFSTINYKEALYTGIGFLVPVVGKWSANLEAYRFNQLKGAQHPNEVYLGARHQSDDQWASFAGVSSGGGQTDGTSNDWRVSVGIKFFPGAEPHRAKVEAPIMMPTRQLSKRQKVLQQEQDSFGKLVFSDNLYFDNNSIVLGAKAQHTLNSLLIRFSKKARTHAVIEGFASSTGNSASNYVLSQRRASEVKRFLVTKGIQEQQIQTVAYGDAKADASGSEALNRKVMIRIYQKDVDE